MFEQLTDRARQAIVDAQGEAKTLRHNYIGTEHLLLGLISEGEGVAAQALHRLGLNLDEVRAEVHAAVPPADEVTGHQPFTPRAKRVLERASHQAHMLNSRYTGTEHLLLGLLMEGPHEGEGDSAAWQLFEARGLDRDQIRSTLVHDILGLTPPDEN